MDLSELAHTSDILGSDGPAASDGTLLGGPWVVISRDISPLINMCYTCNAGYPTYNLPI